MKTKYIVGTVIAALTDVGMGVLILHLARRIFDYQIPAPFYLFGVPVIFYMAGMAFPLIPDLNVLRLAILGKRIDEKHRTWDHYPIIMILSVSIVFYFISFFWADAIFWGIVIDLCLLYHYIHDSIEVGGGTGMQWLGPFSEKYYQLFARKDGKRRLISSFRYEDFQKESLVTLEEWLDKYYLKPTFKSLSGIAIFLVAISLPLIW